MEGRKEVRDRGNKWSRRNEVWTVGGMIVPYSAQS